MLHTKLFTSLLLIRAKYWKQVYPKLCIKIRMVKKNNRIWKCITGEVAVWSRSYLSFPGMSNDWEKCEEKQESYSFGQNGMDFSSGSQAFLDFYYKKAEWRSASLASLWSWTEVLYCPILLAQRGTGQCSTALLWSQICVWNGANISRRTSLSLSLPICRMEIIIVSTSLIRGWEINKIIHVKFFTGCLVHNKH